MTATKIDFSFSNKNIKDKSYPIIYALILIGAALTIGAQEVAKSDHNDALQKLADAIYYGGYMDKQALHGQPWRFVTHMFLHGGIVHLVMNLMAFSFFYHRLKTIIPKYYWMLPYFLGGIGGAFLQYVWTPNEAAVGASGGLCGLWGCLLAAMFRYRKAPATERPWHIKEGFMVLVVMIVFQALTEMFIPNVGHGAHLGGLIVGTIIGMLMPLNWQPRLVASRKDAVNVTGLVQHGNTSGHYFDSVQLEPAKNFDAAHDFVIAERDSIDWSNKVTLRYELLAGTMPEQSTLQQAPQIASAHEIRGNVPLPLKGEEITLSNLAEPDERSNTWKMLLFGVYNNELTLGRKSSSESAKSDSSTEG